VEDRAGHLRDLRVVRTGGTEPGRLKRPRTHTVAVVSGKGGVGKTSLAANLALAIKQQGRNVLLVDGDWGMANVDLVLGLIPRFTLHDVVLGDCTSDEAMIETEDGIHVLPGVSGIEDMANLDDLRCERLLCSIADAEKSMDLILIDTSSGINRNTTHLARAADEIIIVTTPEPTARNDAYATLKVLTRNKLPGTPWIVVNQARTGQEARDTAERIRKVAKRYLEIDLGYLGYVVYDPAVGSSIQRQEPLMRIFPDAPGARCIARIAERMTAEPEPEPCRADDFKKVVNMEDAPA